MNSLSVSTFLIGKNDLTMQKTPFIYNVVYRLLQSAQDCYSEKTLLQAVLNITTGSILDHPKNIAVKTTTQIPQIITI